MASPTQPRSSKGQKQPHISEQPVTLSNWYRHIDWVNVTFVAVIPFFGLIATCSTPLLWKTAVWALIYYFLTGLGITAGKVTSTSSTGSLRKANKPQAITDSGPTPPTPPRSPSNLASLPLAAAPSKVRSDGGHAITAPTTATPTRSKIPTQFKRESSTHTWAGWCSSKTRNPSAASTLRT
jgi:stearoyl-CoA desaturase (delta-9 desaturase)